MAGSNGWTPTELRILKVLSDGKGHPKEELHKCLEDDLAQLHCVAAHICFMRRKLPKDEAILCVAQGHKRFYQHVRFLVSY